MNAFLSDEAFSFFRAPFEEGALSSNIAAMTQGTLALMQGFRAVNAELSRFIFERVGQQQSVALSMLDDLDPGRAAVQLTDYFHEAASAWDEEGTKLIGIMMDAVTQHALDGEATNGLGVWPLP